MLRKKHSLRLHFGLPSGLLGASAPTLLGLVSSYGVCGNLLPVNREAVLWSGVNTGFGVKLIPDQTPALSLRSSEAWGRHFASLNHRDLLCEIELTLLLTYWIWGSFFLLKRSLFSSVVSGIYTCCYTRLLKGEVASVIEN